MTEHSYPWIGNYGSETLDWSMEIDPKPVFSFLEETVSRTPQAAALDFMGKVYSWAELGDLADKFARGLQNLGVRKGVRVGLFLPNCPYFIIAYYAVLKIGGTVVNFNPLYAQSELEHQIEDSETEIMVTLDLAMLFEKMEKCLSATRLEKLIICKFTDILAFPKNLLFPIVKGKDMAKIRPQRRVVWFHDLIDNDGDYTPAEIDVMDDVAVLQYTGGTTGVPKGAMLTHCNLYSNVLQAYAHFPDPGGKQESMVAVLPFFHVFAMTVTMNLAIHAGMKILTIPRFELDQTLKLIHKHKPDYMAAVPAIFNAMNNHKKISSFNLKSLKFCISGGAPLPVEVKKKFEEKTGAVVVEGYGLTEASPVTHVNPPCGENVAGSIGLPLPRTVVEIIDYEDKETPMPMGERGEVCIRGPQVMKGYWNKPEATADVLRKTEDGEMRLYTGDIGIMDEKGYVYIVDRIKDMIITNGYNVYPRNIEEGIYQHPSVEECIVAGLPHPQRGEIVKAWIKLKEGRELSADDLKTFLEDKLSKMEMPKLIEFRDEPLPKTLIGKLSRKDIVAQELEKKS
ncbi:MAG: long-chain fatty acid--CoA ligase [Alphaproteobacteria bacterium]|nr:long-chain fatty acid--CoA ligase [Alphaproteobacteria bacterium]